MGIAEGFAAPSLHARLSAQCDDTARRLGATARGTCPVDMTRALAEVAHAQSCGKCVPCRIGLASVSHMLEEIIDGKAEPDAPSRLGALAEHIRDTSDCAIGYQAAEQVLMSLAAFRDDFEQHMRHGSCLRSSSQGVPCVVSCPAQVDVPGYIALTAAGRYDDAVELIRKDNPFPSACAYVCEHPCEQTCRRALVDDAINIRGLKRYAVDHAAPSRAVSRLDATGKRVAVVGAGPSGLSAAYYLARLGHDVVVYEKRAQSGGMLRYGIPSYRFPREVLDAEIASIEAAGVRIRCGVDVADAAAVERLRAEYDAVYVAIGAHGDKKAGIEGEDAAGVVSAVSLLRGIGDGVMPDWRGRDVCVVGGGNVAMDAARTAVRLGAAHVTVAYRRRIADMTALPEEIEGAIADGCRIADLMAPVRIVRDAAGSVCALELQPQVTGPVRGGRPAPVKADRPLVGVPCSIVVMAIGQEVQSGPFSEAGLACDRKTLTVDDRLRCIGIDGVYAGGDCMRGPASAIAAIADGKRAARSIDEDLGYRRRLFLDMTLPPVRLDDRAPWGRAVLAERAPEQRRHDFELIEHGFSHQEMRQEAARCLNCDHFGCGILHKEGRMAW
ncbi:MAG: NAD(P)-binding protein [Slackia sp.]|nr:NAD(P)-binding protein [Slackia sp.]